MSDLTKAERNIVPAIKDLALGHLTNAAEAQGHAVAALIDGLSGIAAEHFERAARLCRMADECRRVIRLIERERGS